MSPLLVHRDDHGVVHLTLNRPESRNAMSLAMVDELLAALDAAQREHDTRAIVLRGSGGHFCAGADVREMAAARGSETELAAVNARFGHLCAAFATTPLAVIAVLEGTVMGGGFGLACAADVAIASETTAFRVPETSLGVVPAQIAPLLVERIGYAEAKRLAVTGGRVDAWQALVLRLVHEVHAPDALDTARDRVIAEVLQCAPGAIAATKALLAKARFAPAASLVDEAAALFARAAFGPEGLEGTTAFLQKRPPIWAVR